MPRTSGQATKMRILQTAEKLFARKGFDATSVDLIARTAKVNKALVYYHFKDKNDLILSLFSAILEQLNAHLEREPATSGASSPLTAAGEIDAEIRFLSSRKSILSLMLSDALRSGQRQDFLFQCAQLTFRMGHGAAGKAAPRGARRRADQRVLVQDFFTGFIPLVVFVVLGDKWCQVFGADRRTAREDFVDAFLRSHLASQAQDCRPRNRPRQGHAD
jgi:AcrR family transcriptional regulator